MRARILATAAVAALAIPMLGAVGASAASGANSPTATHDNPSSCLGAERATSNSNGGAREHGEFGQQQSAYVALINSGGTTYGNYGDAIAAFKAGCSN